MNALSDDDATVTLKYVGAVLMEILILLFFFRQLTIASVAE